jgi:NAD-dependent SIR2 family protein deacetylase
MYDEFFQGGFKHIIVVTGAGISTSAGIPDYRSKNGLFVEMKKEFPEIINSEDLFQREFFEKYNIGINPTYLRHISMLKDAIPTLGHEFCNILYQRGLLRRVYTQNIDGLHQKAGLPDDMVVEFHGSILKNNVVLYGDKINDKSIEKVVDDFVINPIPVDLLIVMGTSLQVAPFCAIPNLVQSSCVRMIVDLCPERAFKNEWSPQKINYDHGFYSKYMSSSMSRSYVVFSKRKDGKSGGMIKRKVTLRPQWIKSKYKKQIIIQSDIDSFAKNIIDNLQK